MYNYVHKGIIITKAYWMQLDSCTALDQIIHFCLYMCFCFHIFTYAYVKKSSNHILLPLSLPTLGRHKGIIITKDYRTQLDYCTTLDKIIPFWLYICFCFHIFTYSHVRKSIYHILLRAYPLWVFQWLMTCMCIENWVNFELNQYMFTKDKVVCQIWDMTDVGHIFSVDCILGCGIN